jgi:CDP-paratose 2-epimerase
MISASSESTILITGGAGFIGSNLAASYLEQGRVVTILDNLSRPGSDRNLAWLQQRFGDRIHFVNADIRDASAVQTVVQSAAIVFHFAAQVAVTTSLSDPMEDYSVNAGGTLNVLEAARRTAKPPCVVLTSTNKVYGALQHIKMTERASRYEPREPDRMQRGISESETLSFHSPYGCSKGAADQYALDYCRSFGVPTVVFRMSCICGPHQSGNEDQGWLAHFLIRAVQRQAITIFGSGKQVRDILYIGDLVRAFHLVEREYPALAGQAFNIGGGPAQSVSLLEVLDAMRMMTRVQTRVLFSEGRIGDQRWYVSDTTKFMRATGWQPCVSVSDSMKNIYEWLQSSLVPAAARGERVA